MKKEEETVNMVREGFDEIAMVKDSMECMLMGIVTLHGLEIAQIAVTNAFCDIIEAFMEQRKFNDLEMVLSTVKDLAEKTGVTASFEFKGCNNKVFKI